MELRRLLLLLIGQKYLEHGPASTPVLRDAAAQVHQAARLHDDLVAHPQSKSRSCHFFRGEKRLEHTRTNRRLHAGASVRNGKAYAELLRGLPVARAPRAHHKPPTSRCGVD